MSSRAGARLASGIRPPGGPGYLRGRNCRGIGRGGRHGRGPVRDGRGSGARRWSRARSRPPRWPRWWSPTREVLAALASGETLRRAGARRLTCVRRAPAGLRAPPVRAGRRRRRRAAAAGRRKVAAGRRRGEGVASNRWRRPIFPAAGPGGADRRRRPRRSEARRRIEELAATVLAAEAAGVARWSLDTAVEYAKVREQFGKPIGSFQAIKHLCAEMLCRAEQADGGRRRRRARRGGVRSSDQFSLAAALAASHRHRGREGQRQGLHPGARRHRHAPGSTTRTCTCAARYGIGQFLGGRPQRWLRRVAALTQAGVRRRLRIDLDRRRGPAAARSPRPSPRSPRCPSRSAGRARRGRAAGAALAGALRARRRRRPSSW